MPKCVCDECGYEHRFLCKPGCYAFSHQGSCRPRQCPKCGAPATKMHME